eukprot:scaffold43265_cov28-Attheya_sp.AAC.4
MIGGSAFVGSGGVFLIGGGSSSRQDSVGSGGVLIGGGSSNNQKRLDTGMGFETFSDLADKRYLWQFYSVFYLMIC